MSESPKKIHLVRIYALCEKQKTVSTRKLMPLIDDIADLAKLDAIHFRALADQVQMQENARTCAKSWDATMFEFNEHIEMLEMYYDAGKKAGFEYAESFEKLN